ncbi:MAG: hypothetical protein E6R03_01605 [Hyphomicrobiaceae bacterium]|nr:MAG: hypothetical protein E6R03_01605 [Hyphomicrobiaceae bacterium]
MIRTTRPALLALLLTILSCLLSHGHQAAASVKAHENGVRLYWQSIKVNGVLANPKRLRLHDGDQVLLTVSVTAYPAFHAGPANAGISVTDESGSRISYAAIYGDELDNPVAPLLWFSVWFTVTGSGNHTVCLSDGAGGELSLEFDKVE